MERNMSDVGGHGWLVAAVTMLTVSIVGCSANGRPLPASTMLAPTDTPAATMGDKTATSGEAQVDSIEILVLESFPVQIHVVARGNLPDGCTKIDEIVRRRSGNDFLITITTVRPADAICAQALVPFEEIVSLDVYGLKAGTYTVDVNGVTDVFALDIDNAPQGGALPRLPGDWEQG